jgi:hypothetical protein
MTKATTDRSCASDAATGNDDDDDPFYKYDHLGFPLSPERIRDRQWIKELKRKSPEQIHALLIEVGTLNPDGSIPDIYFEEYDHGPQRWRP